MLLRTAILLPLILSSACQNTDNSKALAKTSQDTVIELKQKPLREKILTVEEQKALSSDTVIARLKAGIVGAYYQLCTGVVLFL